MKKKFKVALYFQSLSRQGGGAEKNIVWLANKLNKNNFEVHLLSWDKFEDRSFYHISDGINWHKMQDNNQKKNKIRKFFTAFKIFKKYKIRVLIGFVISGDGTLILASILNQVKIICAERNEPSMYEILYSPLRKRINFTYMFFSNYIIVQQNIFKKLYPLILQNKILTIPNPVFKEEEITSVKQICNFKKILFIGRLDKNQKRPMILLKAFNKIKNEIPGWKLHFVGDGNQKKIMEDYIKNNDLISKVRIFNSSTNIINFYNNSSIFVSTSLWEGFPNALAEAMSKGLACIGASDSLAIKNLLKKNCGWLVDNLKEDNLSKELVKCIFHKEERLKRGINAKNEINKYNPNKIYKYWEKIILSLNN